MAVSTMPIDPLLELPRVGRATDSASCDDDATGLAPAILLRAIGEVSDTEAGVVIVREDVEAAYQRLYPQLVRLAFLLVDTNEHAEEAGQDAFAKAYSKWGRVEHADSYMRMAVVNTCRRVQRRRMLARRTPTPAVGDAVLGADHVGDVVRKRTHTSRSLNHTCVQLSRCVVGGKGAGFGRLVPDHVSCHAGRETDVAVDIGFYGDTVGHVDTRIEVDVRCQRVRQTLNARVHSNEASRNSVGLGQIAENRLPADVSGMDLGHTLRSDTRG